MWTKFLLFSLLICGATKPTFGDDVLSGRVQTASGTPIAMATVRFQAETLSSHSDQEGRFTIAAPRNRDAILTATSPGFYIGGVKPGTAAETVITLRPLP